MRIIIELTRDDIAATVAGGQGECGMHRSTIQHLFGGLRRDNCVETNG